jgi:hypothetical protein
MLIYRVHLALGSSNTHRRCHNTLLHCLLLDAGSGGRVRSMSPFLWPYLIGAGEALLLPVWGPTRAGESLLVATHVEVRNCGRSLSSVPGRKGNARSSLTPNSQPLSGMVGSGGGAGLCLCRPASRRAPAATTCRRARMTRQESSTAPELACSSRRYRVEQIFFFCERKDGIRNEAQYIPKLQIRPSEKQKLQ